MYRRIRLLSLFLERLGSCSLQVLDGQASKDDAVLSGHASAIEGGKPQVFGIIVISRPS